MCYDQHTGVKSLRQARVCTSCSWTQTWKVFLISLPSSTVTYNQIMEKDSKVSSSDGLQQRERVQTKDASQCLEGGDGTKRNTLAIQDTNPEAPDGGWGWMVVLGAFVNGLVSAGFTSLISVLYVEWIQYFDVSAGELSWIGFLFPGTAGFVSKYISRDLQQFLFLIYPTFYPPISLPLSKLFMYPFPFSILHTFFISWGTAVEFRLTPTLLHLTPLFISLRPSFFCYYWNWIWHAQLKADTFCIWQIEIHVIVRYEIWRKIVTFSIEIDMIRKKTKQDK